MIKRSVSILLSALMCISLVGCGEVSEEEREYVSPDQIQEVYTNPNDFKGKYIKVSGQVFSDVEKQGDEYGFQMLEDVKNNTHNTVVLSTNEVHVDDFIEVDGRIDGVYSGSNMLGGDVKCLQISNATCKVIPAQDAVAPAISVKEFNDEQEQHGIKLVLEKIEFADSETRAFIKVVNNSDAKFDFFPYESKAIQNSKQINESSNYYYDSYDAFGSSIAPGAEVEGFIVFPNIDDKTDFKLIFEGYSDNYEIQVEPFEFNVSA